jgi:hypothetical protein
MRDVLVRNGTIHPRPNPDLAKLSASPDTDLLALRSKIQAEPGARIDRAAWQP